MPPPSDAPRAADRYALAASIYDLSTALWSGGAIWRTRARCLEGLRPGEQVLIPGPGTGRSAVAAGAAGARVLAVDRSPAMVSRARRRLARADPAARARVELRQGDWEELAGDRTFDLVVAEHFLNVFSPSEMPRVREALLARVAPGGRLAVADFAPLDPADPAPLRALQSLHHLIPLSGCALLTRNAMHPIHDHGADLAGRPGLELVLQRDERSHRAGPRWWRTWIFRRDPVAGAPARGALR